MNDEGNGSLPSDTSSLSEADRDRLQEILSLLHAQTGSNFSHYKHTTLLRRINRRMQTHQLEELDAYAEYLSEHPVEINALYDELLISVTHFFRDPEAFEILADRVIPELFEQPDPDEELRIWVPACATGEEAYSVAILLAEASSRRENEHAVRIFATDIDKEAVATGRSGCYPEASVENLSSERLDRFFEQDEGRYCVEESLREMTLFAEHNLLHDPPFSRLHLISCRNFLIYLNPQAQEQLFHLFHYGLRSDGYLFLGSSESTAPASNLFEPVDSEKRIFKPRPVASSSIRLPATLGFFDRTPPSVPSTDRSKGTESEISLLHQKLLVQRYAPPSVIVDENYRLLHISGGADRFLTRREGLPSNNLLENVSDELRLELHSALYRVAQYGESTLKKRVQVTIGDRTVLLDLTVEPVTDDEGRFLVLFEEIVPEQAIEEGEPEPVEAPDEKTRQLEEELTQTKRELQALIEEYETSNEELQSANEELKLMNEELQTSQDQLRATNEALEERVAARTEALAQANARLDLLQKVTRAANEAETPKDGLQVAVDEICRFTGWPVGHACELDEETETLVATSIRHVEDTQRFALFMETLEETCYMPGQGLPGLVLQSGNPAWVTDIAREDHYPATNTHEVGIEGAFAFPIKVEENVFSVLEFFAEEMEPPSDELLETMESVGDQLGRMIERHRQEEALRESREKYRRLFAEAQHGVAITTPDGGLIDANPAAQEIFGYTLEELKEINLTSLYIDPDERREVQKILEEKDALREFEIHLRRKDGQEIVCLLSAAVRRDAEGNIEAYQKIFRDITDRKRIENELRQYDNRVKDALGKLPVYIFNQDRQLRYTWLSNTLPGLDRDEALGKTDDEIFPEEQAARFMEVKREVLDSREPARVEMKATSEDEPRYYDTYLTPQRDETGAVVGIIGASVDVTERKQTEQQRRRSERKYRELFEASRDAIAITSGDEVIDINQAGVELLGYSKEELEEMDVSSLYVDPEQRRRGRELLEEHGVLRDFEVRVRRKDGEEVVCLLTSTAREKEEGEPELFYTIFRDITERKQAEQALRESEEKFRTLAEKSLVGIYLYQEESFQYVNPRFAELFGYEPEEIIQQKTLQDFIHPDDWPRARENFRRRLDGEETSIRYQSRGVTKDGEIIYVEAFGTRIVYQGRPAIIGTLLDVTERRRMQQEILRIQDEEQRRIGQELHDGVASQLTGLAMMSEGLARDAQAGKTIDPDELEEISQMIRESAQDTRLLSRGLSSANVDGETLVDSLERLIENTELRTGLSCRLETDDDLPRLSSEPATHLYRIAQEAVSNAVKHAEADQILVRLSSDEETYVLSITDDGIGLPDETAAAEGEGIGLRSMRYRAELIGADLQIERRLEGGTKVRCSLSRHRIDPVE